MPVSYSCPPNSLNCHGYFQVPNPFGQDAGRGAMEGVGEEEWVVTKDKEKGINIHILLFQKKK